MCILFSAINQHPEYPLVIAANRDEYHARPSRAMHEWQDQPGVVAGRDLKAGGTWLGVHRSGKFAAVTNYRTGSNVIPNAKSRGELVVKSLVEENFANYLGNNHDVYSPFNLLFGDRFSLNAWDYRNRNIRPLADGFHSVSNGPIDEHWPKMSHGVDTIARMISQHGDIDVSILSNLMRNALPAPDNQLPNTGLPIAREKALSSIFVEGEIYGTRTTTILLFGHQGVDISETNFAADASECSYQKLFIHYEPSDA